MSPSEASVPVPSWSGKTVKAFWNDAIFWVDGLYAEDCVFAVNGRQRPDLDIMELEEDTDAVQIFHGYVLLSQDATLPRGHALQGDTELATALQR